MSSLCQVTRVGIVSSSGETVEHPASLVGTDAQHDIAVLLVDAPEHTFLPVQVGTSANLRTGQSVYAIGNPLGFSKTLTAGVVSGVNRAIPSPVGTKTYGAIQVSLTQQTQLVLFIRWEHKGRAYVTHMLELSEDITTIAMV